MGRLAARTAVDDRLIWLQPPEEIVRRHVAPCYLHQREASGTVMTLVDTVRDRASG